VATYNKFNIFTTDLCQKVHNVNADLVKVYLTLTAPVATNSIKTDTTEIATGNGYTGPVTVTPSGAGASGTYTLSGTAVVFTASGGAIANFGTLFFTTILLRPRLIL
jgi:hypothetical protein